jgi:hypothetical protein
MRAPATPRLAYAALVWTVVMYLLFAAASAGLYAFRAVAVLNGISFAAMLVFMAVIGVLIARHEPAQPVGWLFSVCPALVTSSIGIGEFAHWAAAEVKLPSAAFWFWLALWPWAVGLIGFILLLPLLFPDGHPPGRRWQWVLRVDLVAIAALALLIMVQPVTVSDDTGSISNPVGMHWAGTPWAIAPVVVCVIVLILTGLASAVVRYRRSSGIERLQMREVLWAAMATVVGFVLISVTLATEFLDNLDYLLIPLAVCAAMLRYRLYQVDVIIRRTLTYAILVAVLAAIYLAGIALIGAVARDASGQSGALAVTLSTLAAAAAFTPLRRRIQRTVDRRFNRAAYDARSAVDGFSGRLREQVDLELLSHELLEVVAGTVQPANASLWLRDRGAQR